MGGATLRRFIGRHSEIGIVLIAILLVVLFSSTSSGRWANLYNFNTILQITATLGLISIGIALVIGTGEIDISIGSIFGMGALTYLWLVVRVDPLLAAMAATAVGGLIGVFNGWLITRTGTSSLIITLGSLMIFRGVAIALTDGFSFSAPYAMRSDPTYWLLGGGELFGFNTALIWLLLGLAVFTFALKRMRFGNHLLATGGDAESAHSRGVRVDRVKFRAFVISGLLAGFAGALEGGKLGFADGSMGRLMELQAIAAAVLGGCALTGGRVSLLGTVIGVFVLSSIQSYLVVMGVRPQWFMLLLGLIVVIAALGDRSLRAWALRR